MNIKKKFWKEYEKTDELEKIDKIKQLGLLNNICSTNYLKHLLELEEDAREHILLGSIQTYFDDIINLKNKIN